MSKEFSLSKGECVAKSMLDKPLRVTSKRLIETEVRLTPLTQKGRVTVKAAPPPVTLCNPEPARHLVVVDGDAMGVAIRLGSEGVHGPVVFRQTVEVLL